MVFFLCMCVTWCLSIGVTGWVNSTWLFDQENSIMLYIRYFFQVQITRDIIQADGHYCNNIGFESQGAARRGRGQLKTIFSNFIYGKYNYIYITVYGKIVVLACPLLPLLPPNRPWGTNDFRWDRHRREGGGGVNTHRMIQSGRD